MDTKLLEKLKYDLKEAVNKKDYQKIEELRNILNISDEQAKYFNDGLTGYPSIDKIWLKDYSEGAEERANNIPVDKTVWDVIEEKLLEYYDYPALEYFGRTFSRQEFIDLCYTWARTFRAMGVDENEIVPVYGPFVPDICAMVFGLNMIGACPYFLKLAISKEALEEETREAKIAVVFDGMWANVAEEFTKAKFKNVIVATVTADMPSPKKQIVSFLSKMQAKKNKSQIPDEKKYIWADKARDIANYYSGNVKVPFESNRSAFITSSSGTTVGGVVKGVVATNESVLAQVYSTSYSDIPYEPGDKTLNHFPPTAATSLNSLFLVGLFKGASIIIDPRVSEKDFYNQLVNLKPNFTINTGSLWDTFFTKVACEMKNGKKFDFSCAKGWMVGGEGTSVKKIQQWDKIMKDCGGSRIYGGYGLSETFSGLCIDRVNNIWDFTKQVTGVGLPQAGMDVGIFDENDNELTYNQRGELRAKTKTEMKGYYNKPELTASTKVNGWIKTGDLAEIDEKGFVYVWGRVTDSIKLQDGKELYLFDVANNIKENDFIDDAVVLSMPTENNSNSLVAHIVWNANVSDDKKKEYIDLMNKKLNLYLPMGIEVIAYSEHDKMLPYSPTTLKKDKNKMSNQTNGYIQVIDDEIRQIEFMPTESGVYNINILELDYPKEKNFKKN